MVPRVLAVQLVHWAPLAQPEHRERRALTVPSVRRAQERLERRGRKDSTVWMGRLAQQAQPEASEPLVLLAQVESQDPPGRRGTMALLVPLGLRVRTAMSVSMVQREQLVLRALMAWTGQRETRARRDPRVQQVLARRGPWVPRVQSGQQV